VHATVCYEQPLNERIRMLLRLEFLFRQITENSAGNSIWHSRMALQGLFDILALTARNELKAELIKELERHSTALNGLRDTPGVDEEILDTILKEIGQIAQRIRELESLSVEELRQNDLLNTIRQRSIVPGGTCPFDLPAFHYWLQQDHETRTRHLQNWCSPFQPMKEAAYLILRLTRESALPRRETAEKGFFQRSLDNSLPNQLVRVFLSVGSTVFPEISAGKHRFSIRFMEQSDPNKRAAQTGEDIGFHLVCCAI
jgi:cell division protein ZapD